MTPAGRRHGPDRRVLAGHVALSAVQVGFGLFPVFGMIAFQPGGFSPLGVGTWRIGVGALVLGVLALLRYGRTMLPARRDIAVLVACAMLGVAVNQGLFLVGLSRSTPMNAGLVMSLIPVFTFAIAAAVGLERFSGMRAVGVLVALGGTAPLLLTEGLNGLGAHGLGNLLMVANGLSYSCYLVLSKPAHPPLSCTGHHGVVVRVCRRCTPRVRDRTALHTRAGHGVRVVVTAVHPRDPDGTRVSAQHVRPGAGAGIDGRRVRLLAAAHLGARELDGLRRATDSGHGACRPSDLSRYLAGEPATAAGLCRHRRHGP